MKRINVFYLSILLVSILLFVLLQPTAPSDLSFYGFAESNETEINYNYPVVVDRILITPGQAVIKGDTLMLLSRRQSKENLEDQKYQITVLEAEEKIWQQRKLNEIDELNQDTQNKKTEIDAKINALKQELEFNQSLSEGLTSIPANQSNYNPIEAKIKGLEIEKANLLVAHDLKINGIREELKLGDNPYREKIKRYMAESAFEESQKIIPIIVTAPSDGLIGNITCKEEEHIPSFRTLLSFYEPHSSIIRGYVHEDLTLQVKLGDQFSISSLKDEKISYPGVVIGLGSRIIEIPVRLRKMVDIKTYGREVTVEISTDNVFLQKEKVSLSFVSSPGIK